jgi:hypothetical protein
MRNPRREVYPRRRKTAALTAVEGGATVRPAARPPLLPSVARPEGG